MDPVPLRERWLPLLIGCVGIAWGLLSVGYLYAALFGAYTVFVLSPAGGRTMASMREKRRRKKG